jgi:hypothetical protein
MCIKWFSDGDVHKYFNPYDSPYEGFITFMNVLNDIVIRIRDIAKKKASASDTKISSYSQSSPGSYVHSFISENPSAEVMDLNMGLAKDVKIIDVHPITKK